MLEYHWRGQENNMVNEELINYWIESSEEDYDTMKVLYNSKKYTWCLFVGHLVIEKLLKGVHVRNNQEHPYPPKSHDLLHIAKKSGLELDERKEELLDIITRFNLSARYDDFKKDFYNKCTEEYTSMQIQNVEEVRKWLKELLMKK